MINLNISWFGLIIFILGLPHLYFHPDSWIKYPYGQTFEMQRGGAADSLKASIPE